MQIEILSLFPDAFTSFLDQPPLSPAIQKGLVQVRIHNLRSWAGASQSVLTQYGNRRLVSSEPVVACVQSIVRPEQKSQTIILTPSGRYLNERLALELSRLDQLVLVCGRFGGFEDDLAQRIQAQKVSVGDYVLTGGELPAMVVCDCTIRQIPDVIVDRSIVRESPPGVQSGAKLTNAP